MDATQAKKIVESLTAADILQAYSGKPGCACGCRGEYYSADKPTQIRRILKQVQKCEADYAEDLNTCTRTQFWNVADDLQYVTLQVHPGRVYTVYLTSAARRARGAWSKASYLV